MAKSSDEVQIVEATALQQIIKAETESQVDIAKRYPRVLKEVRENTLELAAADQETAEDCFFSLPRKKRNEETGLMEDVEIEGESIRLAEIVAATWTNLRTAKRILNIDRVGKKITAQGICYDVESNRASTVEETKNICGKNGQLYTEDMIVMTGKAAASIALRNAIFEVIPKVVFKPVLKEVKLVAIGEKKGRMVSDEDWKPIPLEERVKRAVEFFVNWGIPEHRIFPVLGVKEIGEITIDGLAKLTGIRSGINKGEFKLIDVFPLTDKDRAAEVGANIAANINANAKKEQESPAATNAENPPAQPAEKDPKEKDKKKDK